jgi:hypothetical protein
MTMCEVDFPPRGSLCYCVSRGYSRSMQCTSVQYACLYGLKHSPVLPALAPHLQFHVCFMYLANTCSTCLVHALPASSRNYLPRSGINCLKQALSASSPADTICLVRTLTALCRLYLLRSGSSCLVQALPASRRALLASCRNCLSRAESICLVQIMCGSSRFYLSQVDSRLFKQVPPVSCRLWEVYACFPLSCRFWWFWWFFHVQPVSYSLAGYLLALFNMYHLSLLLDSYMFSGLSTN